jgi:hypothetical protein
MALLAQFTASPDADPLCAILRRRPSRPNRSGHSSRRVLAVPKSVCTQAVGYPLAAWKVINGVFSRQTMMA